MDKQNVLYSYNGILFSLKEILTHVIMQMNPENIMLREKASHRKTNTVCFHLSEMPRVVKFRKSRAGAGDGGNEGLLFDGYIEFQFCKIKRVWRLVPQLYECTSH